VSPSPVDERIWCEVDTDALAANLRLFRSLVGSESRLAPTVKANGYGHGLVLAGRAFADAGADWLCVHGVDEARRLRAAGLDLPLYVLGPVLLDELAEASALDLRIVVYNEATVTRLVSLGCPMRLHIKLETGNHRQGVELQQALDLASRIAAAPHLELEGAASHFANIEDTTNHRYARRQLARFEDAVTALRQAGHAVPIRHLSNTAAAILWPEQTFEMVRVGIGAYGLWPSTETQVAAALAGRGNTQLRPALTWKTRIAQIKDVPEGAFIGYGCTYMTTHPTRLAILPVGYFDGYDRGLSNLAHVLIRGRRAPVRGRVCMNIVMADVTDIPGAALEDEVVLLGQQEDENVTAEQVGAWAGTINYEVVSRIGGHLPRVAVRGAPSTPRDDVTYRPPKA